MEPTNLKGVRQARPARVAELIDLDARGPGLGWGPDDLAAILRHRLETHSGLGATPGSSADSSGAVTSSRGSRDASLGELFRQEQPAREELLRVKDWARATLLERDPVLPPEVSTLLFYAAVAGGLVRSGERLAGPDELDDAALLRGLRWAAAQSWADESSRELCCRAASMFDARDSESCEANTSELPPVGTAPSVHARPEAAEVPGFEITGRLGEGAMGTVWRAVQHSTRREIALKLITQGAVGSHRARLRFDREVELAARLEHPNIARVYDSGMSRGVYYYAMELVEGVHLDRYVTEKRLDTRQVLSLVRELCLAVQHAHRKGVIHRDLKPSNILVTADGTPKVVDFGLAKAWGDAQETPEGLALTQEGQLAGTPAFMSPEQAAGDGRRIDTRTDVYGLGATLYFLLTGQHPHDISGSRLEVLHRVAQEDARRPRLLVNKLDREAEALLLKAVARDPEDRYSSAGAMGDDISRYLAGDPLAARPPAFGYFLRKRLRKHWPVIGVAALIVAMLGGTGVFSYLRVVAHDREAVVQAGNARRERIIAEQQRADALEQRAEASRRLIDLYFAEGNMLAEWERGPGVRNRFEAARQELAATGQPTFRADWALWEAHDRGPIPLLEINRKAIAAAGLAFLPGGERLASACDDGTVRVWDVRLGRLIRAIPGAGRIRCLAVSAAGRLAACASPDAGVTVWDLDSGELASVIGAFQSAAPPTSDGPDRAAPTSVAFSPDGELLLVGTEAEEQNVHLCNVATGRLVHTFQGQGGPISAVTFTTDGLRAVSASSAGVWVWDLASRAPATSRADLHDVRRLAVSADGDLLVCTRAAGAADLWDLRRPGLDRVHTWTGDGAFTLSNNAALGAAALDRRVMLWPMTTGGGKPDGVLSAASAAPPTDGAASAGPAAFSPDDRLVAAVGADGVIRVWPVYDALRPVPGAEVRTFTRGDDLSRPF